MFTFEKCTKQKMWSQTACAFIFRILNVESQEKSRACNFYGNPMCIQYLKINLHFQHRINPIAIESVSILVTKNAQRSSRYHGKGDGTQ